MVHIICAWIWFGTACGIFSSLISSDSDGGFQNGGLCTFPVGATRQRSSYPELCVGGRISNGWFANAQRFCCSGSGGTGPGVVLGPSAAATNAPGQLCGYERAVRFGGAVASSRAGNLPAPHGWRGPLRKCLGQRSQAAGHIRQRPQRRGREKRISTPVELFRDAASDADFR